MASDDPDEPEVAVPVTLAVAGTPDLVPTADALAFSEVHVGGTAATFGVRNFGSELLTSSAAPSPLVAGEREAGRHAVAWEAAGVASGPYVVVMEAGDFRASGRMMLVR